MRRAIFIAGLCMITPVFGEICDETYSGFVNLICIKKDGTKAGTEAAEVKGNLIAPEKEPERTIVVKSDCPKPRACRAPRACPIAKPCPTCPTCPSYPQQTVNNYYKAPEQPRRNRINLLMGGTYRALTE